MSAVGSIQERIDEGDEKSTDGSSDRDNIQERIDEGDEKSSSGSSGDAVDVQAKADEKSEDTGCDEEEHHSEVSSDS